MTAPADGWERRAQEAGRLLQELATEALDRGDVHEYRHLVAALNAGNSEDCAHGTDCRLDRRPFAAPRSAS